MKNFDIKFSMIISIPLLCLIAYSPILLNGNVFYYDDTNNLLNNTILNPNFSFLQVKNVLLLNLGGFRPISYFSFYLNYLISPQNFINHVFYTNSLIHISNSIVIYFLILIFFKDKWIAFSTTLLFSLSPINFYGVAYSIQRMTSLMTFFGLVSIISFNHFFEKKKKSYLIFSLFFILLSTLSKENGILFLPANIIIGVVNKKINLNKKYFYSTGVMLFFVLLISTSFYYNNRYSQLNYSPISRLYDQISLIPFYLYNLIIPSSKKVFLYLDFKNTFKLYYFFTGLLILFLSLFIFTKSENKKNGKHIALFILLYFFFQILECTTIPLRHAFFHRMYLPSIFFYSLISNTIFKTMKKSLYKSIIVSCIATYFLFTTLTISTMWINPKFYLEQNLKSYPKNPDLIGVYAIELKKEGKIDESLKYIEKGLKIDPSNTFLQNNYLNTLIILKKYKKAVNVGEKYNKNHFILHQLGKAYYYLGNIDKSINYFKNSLNKFWNQEVFIDLLRVYENQKQYNKLINTYNKFEKVINNNINAKFKYINALIQLKKLDKAQTLLKNIPDCFIKHYLEATIQFKQKNYQKSLSISLNLNENAPVGNLLKKVYLVITNYYYLNEMNKANNWTKEFIKRQDPLMQPLFIYNVNKIINNLKSKKITN